MRNPNIFLKKTLQNPTFLFLLFSLFENEIGNFSSTVCPRMPICPLWFSTVARGRGMLTLWPCRMKEKASLLLLSTPSRILIRTERPTRFGYPTRILQYKQGCFTFLKGGGGEGGLSRVHLLLCHYTTWAFCVKEKVKRNGGSFLLFLLPGNVRVSAASDQVTEKVMNVRGE